MNTGELCKHGMQVESCADCRRSIEPDSIRFTKDELEKAARFAQEAPYRDWQPVPFRVSRFNVQSRITYKLGQVAFAKFLIRRGKTRTPMEDVLVDWTDFKTADGRQIYLTSTRNDTYRSIDVPPEKVLDGGIQFYVSVLVAKDGKTALIKGFATTEEMQESGIVVRNDRFNQQYEVYVRPWARLKSIDILLLESSHFRLTRKGLFSATGEPWI